MSTGAQGLRPKPPLHTRLLRLALLLIALGLAALVIVTGSAGAGAGTKDARVQVTSDFGSHVLGSALERRVPGAETVMSLLERHFRVATRYGGGFVESIDGHAGGSDHRDWFYFVNGIMASKGAATTDVHAGDHVWWDLHDWAGTQTIPAVVGSYPEPFADGIGGRKFPTILTCAGGALTAACNRVAASLAKAHVKAPLEAFGTGSGSDSLAVVVGTWQQAKGIIAAEMIAAGPSTSGVYAQFVGRRGSAVELDNPLGDVAETLRGSVGMIAATSNQAVGQPTWFVTGTDDAGVNAAARQFTAAALHDHFAVVVKGTHVIPVPLKTAPSTPAGASRAR